MSVRSSPLMSASVTSLAVVSVASRVKIVPWVAVGAPVGAMPEVARPGLTQIAGGLPSSASTRSAAASPSMSSACNRWDRGLWPHWDLLGSVELVCPVALLLINVTTTCNRAAVICGRRLHRVGHARVRVAAHVHAERLHRIRVAPPAVQGDAGVGGGQAAARVVEHEDAPVGARGRPLADHQVVVAVAVDVHAHDRRGLGVLSTRSAGSPPGHALDVGELAMARVEVDLRARDHVG
eukprot:scaffold3903_cov60-Phaeocystis_antarctica.AAC.4